MSKNENIDYAEKQDDMVQNEIDDIRINECTHKEENFQKEFDYLGTFGEHPHNWSKYRCEICGAVFNHHYHSETMEEALLRIQK